MTTDSQENTALYGLDDIASMVAQVKQCKELDIFL